MRGDWGSQRGGGHWGETAASDQTGSPEWVQSLLPGNAGGATRWAVALCLKESGKVPSRQGQLKGKVKHALPLLPRPWLYK